jgi:hypothetical protein
MLTLTACTSPLEASAGQAFDLRANLERQLYHQTRQATLQRRYGSITCITCFWRKSSMDAGALNGAGKRSWYPALQLTQTRSLINALTKRVRQRQPQSQSEAYDTHPRNTRRACGAEYRAYRVQAAKGLTIVRVIKGQYSTHPPRPTSAPALLGSNI